MCKTEVTAVGPNRRYNVPSLLLYFTNQKQIARVQPTQQAMGLCEGMNTRRQGSLGTILEASYTATCSIWCEIKGNQNASQIADWSLLSVFLLLA